MSLRLLSRNCSALLRGAAASAPKARLMSASTKQVEKRTDEVRFQPDVTIENVDELINLFYGDPAIPQAYIFSRNNLTAITAAATAPWWTARNSEGRIVGTIICPRVGDSFYRNFGGYVDPAYRERGILMTLFKRANEFNLTTWPKSATCYLVKDGVTATIKQFPNEIFEERFAVAMGVPSDNISERFPSSGEGFHVVPFERGYLFDKLVYWDTKAVHMIPRQVFLKLFFTPGVVNGYVALDNATDDVVGYGAIQLAINPKSHILGPVYGESDSIASVLLHNLMKHYKPGNNVGVMYPTRKPFNEEAIELMGLKVIAGADSRYVRYHLPEKFKECVYAISSCGTLFN